MLKHNKNNIIMCNRKEKLIDMNTLFIFLIALIVFKIQSSKFISEFIYYYEIALYYF